MTMKQHHKINYLEFVAPDLSAVKAFYAAAFGWTFTDYGPEYVAFDDGATEGGFAKGESGPKSGPLVILYSNDLSSSLQLVKENGGAITKPIYDFPGGKRFHFADPAGNELAVWSE
jgi:predicted enzyme related to lactoylglutathione lyase